MCRRVGLRVFGCDGGNTGVKTAVLHIIIGVRKGNTGKCLARGKSLHAHLSGNIAWQSQGFPVILLAVTPGSDGDLFLINKRELKRAAVLGDCLRDLIVCARRISVKAVAYNSLVELPAGYRSAGKGKCLADLQYLNVVAGNRTAVHIDKMDRDLYILIAGVVEGENVLICVCSQNKGLLDLVREELDALKLRNRGV